MKRTRIFAILFSLALCLVTVGCTIADSHVHNFVNGQCECGKIEKVAVLVDADNGEEIKTVYVNYTKTLKALETPSKKGYTFSGWYLGEELYDFESKVTTPITLKAKWDINTYQVTYDFGDGPKVEGNPTEFNVTDNIVLLKPLKENYDFLGWFEKTSELKYDAINGVAQNLELVAKYKPTEFEIKYHLDEGTNNKDNPLTYTVEKSFKLLEPTKSGYIFIKWVDKDGNEVKEITLGTSGTLELYAKWEEAPYKIQYELNGGTNSTDNPSGYSIEKVQAGITLKDPERLGYDFLGWTLEANSTNYFKTLPTNLLNDITVYAHWTPTTYKLSYVNEGNAVENKASYTIETETFTLAKPSREGYVFNGWYVGNEKKEQIEKGTTGNITLTAKWEVVEYTITYVLNGGTNSSLNPSIYTIEDSVTLQNPTRKGYTFKGWEEGTTIVKGTTGDKTFTAKWEVINYTINYVLNGGTNSSLNPSIYSIEDSVTLQNPTREGYTFKGWEEGSIIVKGTTGDKTFTAKWDAIDYTITYVLNGGTNSSLNPSIYTIEDSVTLQNPTRKGYTFKGWEEGTTITKGTTGDKTFTAKWDAIDYTITYVLNGGINSSLNPSIYTIEDSVTLQNPTRKGYTFKGWEEGTTIVKGTTGDKTFTAKWEVVEYTITYVLNGGINSSLNPSIYTIEDSVTLQNPTRKGYTFKGWEEGTTIVKGTTGDKTFTAKWEVVDYTISYQGLDKATFEGEYQLPTTYTIESEDIVLKNPSKSGYTFAGWYNGDTNVEKIEKSSTGNITLVAKWETIKYEIKYELDGGTLDLSYYKAIINGETIKDITLSIYDNSGLKSNIYFCDKGVVSNNSLRWQYKILLKYDAELKAYEVVAVDAATADANSVSPIWTHAIASASVNVSTYAKVGQYIVLSTEAKLGDTNFEAYVCSKSQLGLKLKEIYYTIESAEIVLPTPTREGYAFDGWYDNDKFSGDAVISITKGSTGNIILYAKWTPKEYSISYELNDGSFVIDVSNFKKYTIETATFTLPIPTKDHYDFKGWYTTEDFQENTKLESIAKGTSGNITLYAKWEPKEYSISYVLNEGTLAEGISNPTKYTIETETFTLPTPIRTNYSFEGWYTTNDFQEGTKLESIVKETSGNITLYAKWEVAPYCVKFNTNGGNTIADVNFSVNSGFPTSLPTATKDGYTFDGWYDNESLDGDAITKITEYKTYNLYAKWSLVTYTITYELNGGTNNVDNPATYTIEESVTLSDPSRNGYTFKGWYDNEEFNGDIVTSIAIGSKDNVTFYAKWEVIEYIINYDFKDANLNILDESKALYSFSLGMYNTLDSKNGYIASLYSSSKVVNWRYHVALKKTSEDNLYKIVEIVSATGSVQLTSEYDLVIIWHSALQDSVAKNALTKINNNASSFIGDYMLITNIPTASSSSANINVKVIDVKNYEYIDMATSSYTIETADFSLPTPTKDGYTFAGWYNGDTKVEGINKDSTGNITLVAKWTVNSYNITYDLAGGSLEANENNLSEYTIETPIFTLFEPIRDGYTFLGWYNGEAKVTTVAGGTIGNLTLVAKWEDASGITEMSITDADATALNKIYEDKSSTPTIIVKSDATDGKYRLTNTSLSTNYSSSIYEYNTNLFTTIAAALENASEGAIIYVFAGTYDETLAISIKYLLLVGPNYDVIGNGNRAAEALLTGTLNVTQTASNLTIQGLYFGGDDSKYLEEPYTGNKNKVKILVDNDITNFKFKNNYITAGTVFLEMGSNTNTVIEYNYFNWTSETAKAYSYWRPIRFDKTTTNLVFEHNKIVQTVAGNSNLGFYDCLYISIASGTLDVNYNDFKVQEYNWTINIANANAVTTFNANYNKLDGSNSSAAGLVNASNIGNNTNCNLIGNIYGTSVSGTTYSYAFSSVSDFKGKIVIELNSFAQATYKPRFTNNLSDDNLSHKNNYIAATNVTSANTKNVTYKTMTLDNNFSSQKELDDYLKTLN